jgi:hypothetical protein
MVGMTEYVADSVLAWLVGKTAMPSLPTVYVGLFTAVGLDDGTGFTEVSGGSYARVVTAGGDWSTPSGSSPVVIENASQILFPQATADWGSVVAFGLFDAVSGGSLLAWDYLGGYDWEPCTVSLASPAVLTAPAHALSNGQLVMFTTEFGGALPTFGQGSLGGQLVVADATTDTFTVTSAGLPVNTTSSGEGMVRRVISQSVPSGVQASFAASSLVIKGA